MDNQCSVCKLHKPGKATDCELFKKIMHHDNLEQFGLHSFFDEWKGCKSFEMKEMKR